MSCTLLLIVYYLYPYRNHLTSSKFEQCMILPEDVEKEKISASVDNGVLNIELPKITQEEKKEANRVIEIK